MALEPLRGPLAQFLSRAGLERPLKGWQALELWADVVGPRAAARSRATAFDSGRLIVEVDGAAWMTQLSYLKREVRSRINGKLGEDIVQEIVLVASRGGPV